MTLRHFGTAAGLALAILAGAVRLASAQDPSAGIRFSPPDAPEPTTAPEPATPAARAIPNSFDEAVGTWDLSLDGSNRRCTLVLSSENGRNGRIVRFPAGCRRALPVLAKVEGWFFADRHIRLIDANIRPVLQFSARADQGSLIGRGETGGTYSLVPLQTIGMLPPDPTPAATAPPPSASEPPATGAAAAPETNATGILADIAGGRAIPGSQPVLPADTLTAPTAAAPGDAMPVPGTYALDRSNDKDVCRIELAPRPQSGRADQGLAAARLLPGCRDSGIAMFDPVAWRFANGHMTLKARKGHAVNLVASGDGAWRRDPDIGTAFVLRRVE